MALTATDIAKLIKAFEKSFPTKEDMESTKQELKQEITNSKDELLSHHSSSHSDRLEKLEDIHPQNQHSL